MEQRMTLSTFSPRVVSRTSFSERANVEPGSHGIIGNSAILKSVLEQVELVAPTDSTVLIQGETGTGKELIARAIHALSSRRNAPFVTLNCAAIPATLLESELFGHERGAFTGAVTQRIGRFEMANGGTLFLDEIGEIAPDLQAKLLRVLQEQEFERLGSARTTRVNVRVVAATNRDLMQMIEAREFRADLYYRLSVFPVSLPPLRDRPEDIPVLARFFMTKYAARLNKTLDSIPSSTMEAMLAYDWPGNIRELQNFVERGVILSRGLGISAALHSAAPRNPRDSEKQENARRRHARTYSAGSRPNQMGARGTAGHGGPPRIGSYYFNCQDAPARDRVLARQGERECSRGIRRNCVARSQWRP